VRRIAPRPQPQTDCGLHRSSMGWLSRKASPLPSETNLPERVVLCTGDEKPGIPPEWIADALPRSNAYHQAPDVLGQRRRGLIVVG